MKLKYTGKAKAVDTWCKKKKKFYVENVEKNEVGIQLFYQKRYTHTDTHTVNTYLYS